MSDDLTREEIKAACEAVGWEWNGRSAAARTEFALTDLDHAVVPGYGPAFHPAQRSRIIADALALLEATGCQYTIERFLRPEPSWGIYMEDSGMGHASGEGFDLPTAAVRAVNQWAETKKETDHE